MKERRYGGHSKGGKKKNFKHRVSEITERSGLSEKTGGK
jgi:hypothetical protein